MLNLKTLTADDLRESMNILLKLTDKDEISIFDKTALYNAASLCAALIDAKEKEAAHA